MSNVYVMTENYLDPDYFLTQTYSSQIVAAPASNVLHGKRRSLYYRSAGYWDVTSSNNAIVFSEDGAADVTATIAVDEYTTTSSFLLAVKAAFDAAGAWTYTVTQDSTTGKINIEASSGPGGGDTLEIKWDDADTTAADLLGFDDSASDSGATEYLADLLRIHTSEWQRFDMGTAVNPKAFILVGQRNTNHNISASATVTLQGNSTDTWTSPEYSQTLTYDEEVISIFSTTGLHTDALRYWRFIIEDKTNPDLYIQFSKVYLGDLYTPTRGAVQFPLGSDYVDLAKIQASEVGNVFVDIKQQSQDYSLSWFGLTKTEMESLDDFIKEVGLVKPFFISMDPAANFSSAAARYVKYVRLVSNPKFSLESPNNFSSSWLLREEL